MMGKIGKIILDIFLSLAFFIVAAIILDSIAGLIFGNKPNGDANVNGHLMLIITSILTIAFAVCFYKYIHLGKGNKKSDKIQ